MNPHSPPAILSPERPRTISDGAVLLEVLLALALFVGAAAVIMSALNASLASLERQRLSSHAVDLAESLLAEIQLGIRPVATESTRPLPAPFQDWTSEISVTPLNGSVDGAIRLKKVEIVVRHLEPALVQRLCQVLRPAAGTTALKPGTGDSSEKVTP